MQKDMRFILTKTLQQRAFINELQEQYAIQQEKTYSEHYIYYDTFDWRLYNKSLLLYSTSQTLVLQSL